MYKIQLSYCGIDRLFYVRLYQGEREIKEPRTFTTEKEAREFIKSVSV